MATSPFTGTDTTFLLFGLRSDRFCLPDTRLVDLSTYLDLHLRSVGFAQIAFHHPSRGVRVTGEAPDSRPAAEPRSAPPQPVGKSLVAGPLGQMTVLRPPTPSAPSKIVQPKTTSYSKVEDVELPSFIQGFFRGEERQAFIFEDFEYFIDFDPDANRTFWSELRDIQDRNMGEKIIIFVSRNQSITYLRGEGENRHFLNSFRDAFFPGDDTVRPNVIRIGAPGADEVLNFQRRLRLRKHVLTHFPALAQNCETNAAEFRAKTDLWQASLKNNMEGMSRYDWTTETKAVSALARLEALPGRGDVAGRIRTNIEYTRHRQQQEKEQGSNGGSTVSGNVAVERLLDHADEGQPAKVNLSYAMSGNPGTGKTVIARLIAEIFKETGILRSGHFIEATVQDLVAGYLGQSALKAGELLSRARGGVLFIDEVQGFEKENQFHCEAIRTILKYAEDHRGDISIIVATYPDKMKAFLDIDSGLPRRFSRRIDLEDYDPATCVQIFNYMAAEKNVEVGPDLQDKLEGFFEAWINDRTKTDAFSNAGSVRNLMEDMDQARFSRGGDEVPLSLEDVPEEYKKYSEAAARLTGNPDERLDHALAELRALPGLTQVKATLQRIVTSIKAQRRRGEADSGIRPGHYSFEGNPGTGKTTVARLMGKIFRELGVLKSGHVVELTRSALVGRYQGHTAQDVKDKAEEALDGVLFIDEAHNLIEGEGDSYGKEAIGELTKILEDERGRLCVIAAGYTEPMERLFTVDSGWESRFSRRLQFEDYEPEDMEQILRLMCAQQKRTLHPDLEKQLQPVLSRLRDRKEPNFANGRSVRKLLDDMKSHLDERYEADPESTDPYQLTLEDIPEYLRA